MKITLFMKIIYEVLFMKIHHNVYFTWSSYGVV